ncbi:hypothetical protein R6Q59_007969 [Mikania micrantha]
MKQNKKGQHKEAWKSRNNTNIELFFTSMEQHKHQEGEINRSTTSNEIKKEKSSTAQHQEGEIKQRKKKDVIHGRALRRREEVRRRCCDVRPRGTVRPRGSVLRRGAVWRRGGCRRERRHDETRELQAVFLEGDGGDGKKGRK